MVNLGVVPGSNKLTPEGLSLLKKRGEAYAAVTGDTGVRSPPLSIFVNKIVDHLPTKNIFVVKNIMRYSEFVGDRTGIFDRT